MRVIQENPQLVMRPQLGEWGFPVYAVVRMLKMGGRTKSVLVVNFSKSSRTTYLSIYLFSHAQFLIFLNIHQYRSADNFFKILTKNA